MYLSIYFPYPPYSTPASCGCMVVWSWGACTQQPRSNPPIDGLLCTHTTRTHVSNSSFVSPHLPSLTIARHHSPSLHACAHQVPRHSVLMFACDRYCTCRSLPAHACPQVRSLILVRPSFLLQLGSTGNTLQLHCNGRKIRLPLLFTKRGACNGLRCK